MKKKIIYLNKWKIKKKQYTGNSRNIVGEYFIKSLSTNKLSEAHWETIFLFTKKFYKKKSFFSYKINKNKYVTSKSLGMRMGKGKGSKKKKIFHVSSGNIFLEIGISKKKSLRDFLLFSNILKKKLPIRSQVFMKSHKFLNL